MIRGVIFDVGNTLVHFDGEWQDVMSRGSTALVEYLSSRGYPLPDGFGDAFLAERERGFKARLETETEYTAQQALTDTLAKHGVCYVPDALIPVAVTRFYDVEMPHWHTIPDAGSTLQQLQARGLKLAVLSNTSDHASVERLAREAGIADYFDPFLTSARIGYRKPSPRAFQPIVDAWQFAPHEIVMVGDAPSFDILGAHRAGMRAVLFEPQDGTAPKPHREFDDADLIVPDAVIRELSELLPLLERV